ncbi:hypothetical protein GJA_2291 [Janthinobacterium agaricidamnosum NBRC 102515 = DSM 9628]|uniref:Uncharacterized protein n=1 Tax=Janthinobacterium agaricidamnosum NBRC 102515 = DSM 9628 TaxID=1349767 RepID=W0V5R2_9BURK|nr:hypothetical protein GJA_2291 [Janthinobacterium agaricidamnosum NBRC 102515 = DSM 9628]
MRLAQFRQPFGKYPHARPRMLFSDMLRPYTFLGGDGGAREHAD